MAKECETTNERMYYLVMRNRFAWVHDSAWQDPRNRVSEEVLVYTETECLCSHQSPSQRKSVHVLT